MRIIFTEQELQSICAIIAHTSNGLTKSELTRHLQQAKINILDDGSSRNSFSYTIGLNKRDWLYNCLVEDYNKTKSFNNILKFISIVMNPINYTSEEKRIKHNYLLEEINKIMLLLGMEIQQNGEIKIVTKAETLDEVDRRVNSLNKKLYDRQIHNEVKKYCIKDYLRKDYYDVIFEASKSLAQRVRDITGLKADGNELFQTAFSRNDPYIILNNLATNNEINEYNGLKELLISIYHLVRNTTAHTPKINWKSDEGKALDILVVISFAHKYLDECYKNPTKKI